MWTFYWENLTTGWSQQSVDFLQPELDSSADLYVGVFNHDARNFTPQQAYLDRFSVETSAVPEPTSIPMWGLGALGMLFAGRKRRQLKLAA